MIDQMKKRGACILLLFVLALFPLTGQSQIADVPEEINMTLDEAIQIALINNYMLRKGALNLEMADQQIREAWGSLYPQVNASGSYTRNIVSPNPFAGSDAGGLFELFGSLEWLAYNENARTDGDPGTEPITFEDFMDRQRDGLDQAGATPGRNGNPFAIDNQFNTGISVTQTLYNGAAFAAIRGAEQLQEISQDQFQREQQVVVDQIKSAFYSALLAKEQVRLLKSSVDRLERTLQETKASVEAGFLSRYESMSGEVELVNLETDLIESENRAELAVRNLGFMLGVPVRSTLNLRGELAFQEQLDPEMASTEEAYRLAVQRRPDLRQIEGMVHLLEVNRKITQSRYLPTLNAFANAGWIGQVPDNRQLVSSVDGESFTYTTSRRGFFDNSYWDPAIAVGVRLQWNLFDGFQRAAQLQQRRIEIRQAEIDREWISESVWLEVEQAVRDLETAYRRIMSQQRNIDRAETNYEHALRRLTEGAGTSLEERQASSLLDQSRLAYLSAVYDYLTAKSRFEKVTGKPVLGNNP